MKVRLCYLKLSIIKKQLVIYSELFFIYHINLIIDNYNWWYQNDKNHHVPQKRFFFTECTVKLTFGVKEYSLYNKTNLGV